MQDATLNVPCPECGKETEIVLREVRLYGKIRSICRKCGRPFDLDGTQLRPIIQSIADSGGNLPPWIKVTKNF